MKPRKIRTTEHEEQTALLQWAAWNAPRMPALALLFSIPNGARTAIKQAGKLKAEGLKAGVPDLFLPEPKIDREGKTLHGLFIEMKCETGRASRQQNAWIKALRTAGYGAIICYSAEEAIMAIIQYLDGGTAVAELEGRPWRSCG